MASEAKSDLIIGFPVAHIPFILVSGVLILAVFGTFHKNATKFHEIKSGLL